MVGPAGRSLLAGAVLLAISACTSAPPPPATPAPASAQAPASGAVETVRALQWVRTSAEYRAVSLQAYRAAGEALAAALADSSWTAAVEQEGNSFRSLPPAVILDVDETVLDNSPFQERMVELDSDFDPGAWNDWVTQASAEAVPGALAFTRKAAQLGVAVFYVTNRTADQEEATRKNLVDLGFPLSAVHDAILSLGEHPEWGSDKAGRRRQVAEDYRVLLLAGDDLGDFVSVGGLTVQARRRLMEQYRDRWGRRWIILPNPIYGSWQRAPGG